MGIFCQNLKHQRCSLPHHFSKKHEKPLTTFESGENVVFSNTNWHSKIKKKESSLDYQSFLLTQICFQSTQTPILEEKKVFIHPVLERHSALLLFEFLVHFGWKKWKVFAEGSCLTLKACKIVNFKDFFNWEKTGKTSSSIFSQFQKTLSFQALEKDVFEKYPTNEKKWNHFFLFVAYFSSTSFTCAWKERVFWNCENI